MITVTAPATAAGTPAYLPYIVGIIIALLGGGGLAALIRSGREGSKIIVDAAQGAVVVQSGVIRDLERRIEEAQRQIEGLTGLRDTVGRLEEENRLLLLENGRLMTRQRELESENAALERRVRELEANAS